MLKNHQKCSSNFLNCVSMTSWLTNLGDVRTGSIPLLVPIDAAGTRGNAFANLGVWSREHSWAAKGFVGKESPTIISLCKLCFLLNSCAVLPWIRMRTIAQLENLSRVLRERISLECKLSFLLLNQRGENMIIERRRDEERVFTTVPSMSTQLSCRIRAWGAAPEFVGSLAKVTFLVGLEYRNGRPG